MVTSAFGIRRLSREAAFGPQATPPIIRIRILSFINPSTSNSMKSTLHGIVYLENTLSNAELIQELAFPQQLPGIHPWAEGADPQHPLSPVPGSLPSCLTPERLEGLDNSFVSSKLPHFRQDTSSLPPYTSFSKTLPQQVQRYSNIGIIITPLIIRF
jgi:hypothetical protein